MTLANLTLVLNNTTLKKNKICFDILKLLIKLNGNIMQFVIINQSQSQKNICKKECEKTSFLKTVNLFLQCLPKK